MDNDTRKPQQVLIDDMDRERMEQDGAALKTARCKKVYIAGKIIGDPCYREKFEGMQQLMEEKGFVVISPAVLPEGMAREDYMRICLAMIDSADAVLFMPDHVDSRGAMIELAYCQYTDKPYQILD